MPSPLLCGYLGDVLVAVAALVCCDLCNGICI